MSLAAKKSGAGLAGLGKSSTTSKPTSFFSSMTRFKRRMISYQKSPPGSGVPVEEPGDQDHLLVGEVWEIPDEIASRIARMERGAGYEEKEISTKWGRANIWIMMTPPIYTTRVESGDWNEKRRDRT